MFSFLLHIREIINKYKTDEVAVYASQASFFIVISFFPFIMLLLTLIQLVPTVGKSDLMELMVTIVPDMLDALVIGIIDDLYTKSPGAVISMTGIVALWSASRGMLGIERGLNRVYESPIKRNYIANRLICTGYTFLFILACVASLILLVLGHSIESFVLKWFPALSEGITGHILDLRSYMATALLVLIFTGLYTVVPVRRHSLKSQIPGALFSTIGWIIFSTLFSIYFSHFSNFSYMYGSLTAVVVLMLWLYICICILFVGAELNYFLEKYLPPARKTQKN